MDRTRIVQDIVCKAFKLGSIEALNDRRSRRHGIVRPRQIAMWLCRTCIGCSYSKIARRFGGFDHTTVIAAVRRVEILRQRHPKFDSVVLRLKDQAETEIAAAQARIKQAGDAPWLG